MFAKNELDRFGKSAGRLGPPNFALAARSQSFDQAVAGQRFEVDVRFLIHGDNPKVLSFSAVPLRAQRSAAPMDSVLHQLPQLKR